MNSCMRGIEQVGYFICIIVQYAYPSTIRRFASCVRATDGEILDENQLNQVVVVCTYVNFFTPWKRKCGLAVAGV